MAEDFFLFAGFEHELKVHPVLWCRIPINITCHNRLLHQPSEEGKCYIGYDLKQIYIR